MLRRTLAAAILVAPPFLASAEAINCRVVGVHDCDTLTCLTAVRQQLKIRLAEIDTPESKQPYGTRAQQSSSGMVFAKDVRLDVQDTDRYGRKVARVYVGGTDVNAEQVRLGSAWVYRQYLKDRSLLSLEHEARQAKRRLWAIPESAQQPHWEWRRTARDGRQDAEGGSDDGKPAVPDKKLASLSQFGNSGAGSSPGGAFSCDTLKSCKQMSSCNKAKPQLQQCDDTLIDGNGDDVACEALCQ